MLIFTQNFYVIALKYRQDYPFFFNIIHNFNLELIFYFNVIVYSKLYSNYFYCNTTSKL